MATKSYELWVGMLREYVAEVENPDMVATPTLERSFNRLVHHLDLGWAILVDQRAGRDVLAKLHASSLYGKFGESQQAMANQQAQARIDAAEASPRWWKDPTYRFVDFSRHVARLLRASPAAPIVTIFEALTIALGAAERGRKILKAAHRMSSYESFALAVAMLVRSDLRNAKVSVAGSGTDEIANLSILLGDVEMSLKSKGFDVGPLTEEVASKKPRRRAAKRKASRS